MAGVDNYDGYAVRTGESRVTITVGSRGNGGHLGFDPAAVLVSPGTRVVWEWSGDGGRHGVAERDGAFESEVADGADHRFERRFEQVGVYRYACPIHRSNGMRGTVTVTGQ